MARLKKPLREHVALAIDGGGIRGAMVARALMHVEGATGRKLPELANLVAGTSTGAIIAGAVAAGYDAATIHDLYHELGPRIFPKSWRTLPLIKYLVRYQYDSRPLIDILYEQVGELTIGELHAARPDFHLVLTATDIYANRTRFIKLYKRRYAGWRLADAVMASSVVPTVFPVFPHSFTTPDMPARPDERWIPEPRYWVDGGVGSYSNPAFLAAYEIAFCLHVRGWRLDNTTLISIGTGNAPPEKTWARWLNNFRRTPAKLFGPEWAFPTVETFLHDANLQQIRLVRHFFAEAPAARLRNAAAGLDFRRYNVNLTEPIDMDDPSQLPALTTYGDILGQMILDDMQEDVGPYSCGEDDVAFMAAGTV
jgi:predicted acylesterase/phospholipase RssA